MEKRLNIAIAEREHRALKMMAAERGCSIQKLVHGAVAAIADERAEDAESAKPKKDASHEH